MLFLFVHHARGNRFYRQQQTHELEERIGLKPCRFYLFPSFLPTWLKFLLQANIGWDDSLRPLQLDKSSTLALNTLYIRILSCASDNRFDVERWRGLANIPEQYHINLSSWIPVFKARKKKKTKLGQQLLKLKEWWGKHSFWVNG